MNYIIRIFALALVGLLAWLTLDSCIISNPQPEECEVVDIVVNQIKEGSSFDIVFTEASGDFYYINRGLEQGLSISDLRAQVLNKKVTLHLPKVITGTSNHIAQLAVGDEVIFTEFD